MLEADIEGQQVILCEQVCESEDLQHCLELETSINPEFELLVSDMEKFKLQHLERLVIAALPINEARRLSNEASTKLKTLENALQLSGLSIPPFHEQVTSFVKQK